MNSKIRDYFDIMWFPISVILALLSIDAIVKILMIMSNLPIIILNSEAFRNEGVVWKFMRRWWISFAQPFWIVIMGTIGIVGLILNSYNWLWILAIYFMLLPITIAVLKKWLSASIEEAFDDALLAGDNVC